MPHHLRVARGIYQVQLAVPAAPQEAVARITGHHRPVIIRRETRFLEFE